MPSLSQPLDPFHTSPLLKAPSRLFQSPARQLNQVSQLIDRYHGPAVGTPRQVALLPLFRNNTELQNRIVAGALQEWQSGVRESGGSNRGGRIDTYARNAKFGPGYEWCGFFAAFPYSQQGFKYPEHFASYQKARDFFLYRSYTSRSPQLHQQQDQLRQSHQRQGNQRQFFIMSHSPTHDYVKAYAQYYAHLNLNQMNFDWQNLPIQPGDIALFSHGHVGLVVSYDKRTGQLETVEGNTSGLGPDGKQRHQAVVRKTYQLSQTQDRHKFDGFGRAALDDFA